MAGDIPGDNLTKPDVTSLHHEQAAAHPVHIGPHTSGEPAKSPTALDLNWIPLVRASTFCN